MEKFEIYLKTLFLTFLLIFLPTTTMAITFYQQHNLVSDGFLPADHIDPNLVNPWGLSFSPVSFAWVANNGTGKATIYDGSGKALPLVVTITSKNGVVGTPTAVISNNTQNFTLQKNGNSAPALFIFAAEDGTISGWAPDLDENNTIIAVDNSNNGASYKGITSAANGEDVFLYAANFKAGTIDVFDASFKPATLSGNFVDPNLPTGYSPFGIQNISGDIFVAYGLKENGKNDASKGKGLGIINSFDANGHFIKRIATYGNLNAPWGLAFAPSSFGPFGSHLIVGNFGDGRILAIDLVSGSVKKLKTQANKDIIINGLWSVNFGNGFNQQSTNALFFTAGPVNETHGLYGTVTVVTE